MKKPLISCALAFAIMMLTIPAGAAEKVSPTFLRIARALEEPEGPGTLPHPVDLPAPRAGDVLDELFEGEGPTFCFTREEVDTLNTIVENERACREDLIECREGKVIEVKSGWRTWEVALLTIGVSVGALALGFGIGTLVSF